MALAEACFVRAKNQWYMGKLRQCLSHSMVQLNLSWRVGQMIVASDNVGDLHLDIVHDHAKIVRRSSVRSRDDQVIQLPILKNDIAFNKIIDNGRSN